MQHPHCSPGMFSLSNGIEEMARVLNVEDESGNLIASLTDVSKEETLDKLRERGNFENCEFMLMGIALRRKQEKTRVLDCATRDAGNFTLRVKLRPEAAGKIPEAKQKPTTAKDERKEQTEGAETAGDLANQKRGMKKCDEGQIHAASGVLEKEGMLFWNQKSQEIEQDPYFRDWGSQERHGVIDTAWTMKKTELLKLAVRKITCEKDSATDQRPVSNILKNFDKLEFSHFTVNSKYKELTNGLERGLPRDTLEADFDKVYSELKKSQADLVKAIEAYNMSCKKTGPRNVTTPPPTLPEEDIKKLAEEVSKGYESE